MSQAIPPHGTEPKYTVVNRETGERRTLYPVDFTELMAHPAAAKVWRRDAFVPHDGATAPANPTGASAALGEPPHTGGMAGSIGDRNDFKTGPSVKP